MPSLPNGERVEIPETFKPRRINPAYPNLNGRKPPGAIPRITRDLKQGIVDAAVAYGSDGRGKGGLPGYLYFLAGKHPKAFAGLLGKLLPLQVNSNVQQSIVGQINIMPIPSGQFIAAADAAKIVEHAPPELDGASEATDGAAEPEEQAAE